MNKVFAMFAIAAMIVAVFAGCIGEEAGTQSTDAGTIAPVEQYLNDFVPQKSVASTGTLYVIEKIPELAVIMAPLSASHTLLETDKGLVAKVVASPVLVFSEEFNVQVMTEQYQPTKIVTVGNVPVSGSEKMDASDMTALSLEIAAKMENPSKTAFVFHDYAIGLAAAPLAAYLGAPMICAESLEAVSGELAALGVESFVTLGRIKGGSMHLAAVSDVQDYFLKLMVKNGDYCNYIVAVNAYDAKLEASANRFPQDSMSMSAAFLAAFHKAVIAVVDVEPGNFRNENLTFEIKTAITGARVRVLAHGMVPEYLCVVGDPVAIPMQYYLECGTGDYADEPVPSDNYYADFDGNPLTQEMAIGRIVGRHVGDASTLVARSMGYDRIIALETAANDPTGEHLQSWIKNAYFLEGTLQIELFCTGDVVQVNKMLTEGGFLTKFRHSAMATDPIARQEIYNNNYIIYYGHGGENGWGHLGIGGIDAIMIDAGDFEGVVVVPGNGIAASCLTSRLDAKLGLDEYCSLAFLHSGCLSYVGGTRVTWGEVKVWPVLESSCNGLLNNRYIENLVRYNETLGNALKIAKNEYYTIASNMDRTLIYIDNNGEIVEWHGLTPWDRRTMLAYPLYGDPAANPYEYRASDVIFG
ncbi:MAG: hypothetical protein CVT48_06360 [Thermoplasmata archaeon HGW-Thermoplasmata-1]|nr:MAG: hypothetical protein CVT48_06360 [Thermoplasmata archaeon HGW-Thermoplasmata-1]